MLRNVFIYGLICFILVSCEKENLGKDSYQEKEGKYVKKKKSLYRESNTNITGVNFSQNPNTPNQLIIKFNKSAKYADAKVDIRYLDMEAPLKDGSYDNAWSRHNGYGIESPHYLEITPYRNYYIQFSFGDESWGWGEYKTYRFISSDINITDVHIDNMLSPGLALKRIYFKNNFNKKDDKGVIFRYRSPESYDSDNRWSEAKFYKTYIENTGTGFEFKFSYLEYDTVFNRTYFYSSPKGKLVATFYELSNYQGDSWEFRVNDLSQLKDLADADQKYTALLKDGFKSFKGSSDAKFVIYDKYYSEEKKLEEKTGVNYTGYKKYYDFLALPYNYKQTYFNKFEDFTSNGGIYDVKIAKIIAGTTDPDDDEHIIATIFYKNKYPKLKVDIRYRKVGDSDWTRRYGISEDGFSITTHQNLKYEFQLSYGGESWSWGGYKTYMFDTHNPGHKLYIKDLSNLYIKNVRAVVQNNKDVRIFFNNTTSKRVDMRYRVKGWGSTWINKYNIKTGYTITSDNLPDGKHYEYQLNYEGEWWSWGGYKTYTFNVD